MANKSLGLAEVVADIAFVAGHRHGIGKPHEIGDSRYFVSEIIRWAQNFENAFHADVDGDVYMELIDAYADFVLTGNEKEAENLLAGMRRRRAIRFPDGNSLESINALPHPAKCALEYFGCQSSSDQNLGLLNRLLDHYFKAYGRTCDPETRETCISIARSRYHLTNECVTAH